MPSHGEPLYQEKITIKNGGVIQTQDEVAIVSVSDSGVVTITSSVDTLVDLTTTGDTVIGDASADTLTVNATSTFNAPVTVGANDTGHDVIFYGATAGANLTWDESADDLILNGAASLVLSTAGASTGTANTLVPVMFTAATEVIAAGNPGAISVATYATHVSADAGGDAFTLASGTVVGQRKRIYFLATAGGTAVVTGAFRGSNNTLTFTNAGEYAELIWDGTDWLDIELGSTNDTNIATPPALSQV